ncbi:MAG: tRNA (adenosine(37)-N6)-threonylcarbamoyltransferase complex ATPase subunit type 1 TsaE [Oscillospiraceae bacterium]|jgi:tRNA threonylcarbamoyladenosine biosynthesis protein TsaE|nr:tRNA (adenosine(37)-N6)-threonylcarbamoyltransferase complex ATPase subunit type 1 TsaE [Oscillospiraceae bacterium]
MPTEFHTTHCVEETEQIGALFAAKLAPNDGVLFKGDLGAGKTCFTRGIVRFLSHGADVTVTSPTFALMNEYRFDGEINALYHFDLYRLTSSDDLYGIGFYDIINSGGVTVCEWSENVPQLQREFDRCYIVTITPIGDFDREITVEQ